MTLQPDPSTGIARTERGLAIVGTRITLYDIMDDLKAGYPYKYTRDTLELTDAQLQAALDYIETHKTEVEKEYREVLQNAEEIRQYWEERNRDRLAQIAKLPPRPGYEAARIKLIQRRMQREAKNQ
ncbi:MAG: DUF433 domain-containing protein [Spirulina sp.]